MKKRQTYITRNNQIYYAARENREQEWRNIWRSMLLCVGFVLFGILLTTIVLSVIV